MAQLLDFISAHKETIACFPLSVFAHMAATIRELLGVGPEASIVHEVVTNKAVHMDAYNFKAVRL